MQLPRLIPAALIAAVALGGAPAAASSAVRPSFAKGIWGPTGADSATTLATAADLGARTYLTTVRWADAAPVRPAAARDAASPDYRWPAGFDGTLAAAAARGMRVVVNLTSAPEWASGAADGATPPRDPADFADFAAAVTARYPGVAGWQIWSEPTKPANWTGLPVATKPSRALTGAATRAAEQYAELLDAAYEVLHGADPRDLVIGGNTWTAGEVSPYQWIRAMHLPGGKPPRMDAFGHNPFSARAANLADPPRVKGYADISDLDDLERWLDRWQRRGGRKLPLYLAEFAIPSRSPSYDFNFYVSDTTQAAWTRAALRLVRTHRRILALGWVTPFDAHTPLGDVTTGLVRFDGSRKPAFKAFAQG